MTIAPTLHEHSKIEIEILLGYVLKQSKEFLYLHPKLMLSEDEASKIKELASARAEGIPIAYLIGSKYFYGLNFKVNKNVLIPRPETEWLVDETLRIIKKSQKVSTRKQLRILDIGTGSGAVAVSIAFHSDPNKIQMFATDISDKALGIAKQNAKLANVDIIFSKSDLLKNIKGKFDIIIANLPYVPETDYKRFYQNLKFEPKLALSDGTDSFILIKKLLAQLPSHLNKKATVLLEIDPKADSLQINGSKKKIIKDIRGLNRFIKFTHN